MLLICDWSSCFVASPVDISIWNYSHFCSMFEFQSRIWWLPWIGINNDENWCKEKNNRQTEPVIVGHWNVKIVSTTKCVWFTAVKFTFTVLNNFQTFFFWLECPFNFALCSILKLHYICKYENRKGDNYWKRPYIYWYTTILFDTFLRWSRLLKVELNSLNNHNN